jgi:hypothetical protein
VTPPAVSGAPGTLVNTVEARLRRDAVADTVMPLAFQHGLDGRRVITLASGAAAGTHSLEWDLRGPGDARVSPGLHFARLEQGSHAAVRRLVVAN